MWSSGDRDEVDLGLSGHSPKHHPQPPPALAVWEFSIPNLPTPPPTFHCIPPTLPPPLCFPSTQPTFSIRVLPLPLWVHHSASVSLSLSVIVLSLMLFCLFSLLSVLPPSIHVYPPLPFARFFCSLSMCMICACSTFSKHFMSGGGGGLYMSIYTTSIIVSFFDLSREDLPFGIQLLWFPLMFSLDSVFVFVLVCVLFSDVLPMSLSRSFSSSPSLLVLLVLLLSPILCHCFLSMCSFPSCPLSLFSELLVQTPLIFALHVLVPPIFWFQAFHPPKHKW